MMNLEINLIKCGLGLKYVNSMCMPKLGLGIYTASKFKMCHARPLSSLSTVKIKAGLGVSLFYIGPNNKRAVLFQDKTCCHRSLILACFSNRKQMDLELQSCGKLTSSDIGKFIRLRGFLQFQRFGQFAVIRDFSGMIQVIFKDSLLIESVKNISYESYIEVIGTVALRPPEQVNERMITGCIEVEAETFTVLNRAKKKLPFLIRERNKPTESLAMQYRYMDLRQTELQGNLILRSQIGKKMRDYLQDHASFIELITPTLSNRTPGGAQEFIVPTRIPDHFYSLVQSPQTYKQLAMIGGFEKYFQFAICYRDEGGEHDRQPEFMQLDLEMANSTPELIKTLLENIIQYSWPDNLPPLSLPFPSMTFNEAVNNYGTDKPDTRFDWKIIDVGPIISSDILFSKVFSQLFSQECSSAKAFVIPNGERHIKRKHMAAWSELAQKKTHLSTVYYFTVTNDNSLKETFTKKISDETIRNLFEEVKPQPEDIIVLAVGPVSNCLKLLGKLRLLSAMVLESNDVIVRHPDHFNFLWVEEFPLFEVNEQSGELQSCHHPFTSPHEEDILLLKSDPKKVRSQHYDLVLNGCEIAGGSIRIHNSELQKSILHLLKIDAIHFQFLIDALECGAPPHGGIALGFDRYISLLRKTKSIRDVIAFPKSSVGKCLMTNAPNKITNEEKELYHISTNVPYL